MKENLYWWKGAVFYQIYPRSFLDTNGDGIGDLPGITEKLDYVDSLGVDGIWISPFFKSPMKDFGYDVSDYKAIDPMFGTIEHFDALLKKAHRLNIRIIIDLVLNHTSDQHPWFLESRRDKTNPKADWYVWADPKEDGSPPNNWVSVFDDVAWTFDSERKQYYLHNFLREQPDLNFHNPEVQEAVLDVARFWLEHGVDGFRLDVVNFYFHDRQLRDNPPRPLELGPATQFEGEHLYSLQEHIHDKSQPENLEFIRRFRKLTDEYGAMTVGEIGDDRPYLCSAQYTSGHEHLNTTYNTQMMTGVKKGLTRSIFQIPLQEVEKYRHELHGGYPSWAFSNHDVVRAASRWHPDPGNHSHDPLLSKMLIALLCSLRGTLFIYQGEELGLPEAEIPFDKVQDPWGKSTFHKGWQGRDGCRTPMPWKASEHAGFSIAEPWLPIPEEHFKLNVAGQDTDPQSLLNFTREFLRWRKQHKALVEGEIFFHDAGKDSVLMFTRSMPGQSLLCVFNLRGEDIQIKDNQGKPLSLAPYGFVIEERN